MSFAANIPKLKNRCSSHVTQTFSLLYRRLLVGSHVKYGRPPYVGTAHRDEPNRLLFLFTVLFSV